MNMESENNISIDHLPPGGPDCLLGCGYSGLPCYKCIEHNSALLHNKQQSESNNNRPIFQHLISACLLTREQNRRNVTPLDSHMNYTNIPPAASFQPSAPPLPAEDQYLYNAVANHNLSARPRRRHLSNESLMQIRRNPRHPIRNTAANNSPHSTMSLNSSGSNDRNTNSVRRRQSNRNAFSNSLGSGSNLIPRTEASGIVTPTHTTRTTNPLPSRRYASLASNAMPRTGASGIIDYSTNEPITQAVLPSHVVAPDPSGFTSTHQQNNNLRRTRSSTRPSNFNSMDNLYNSDLSRRQEMVNKNESNVLVHNLGWV